MKKKADSLLVLMLVISLLISCGVVSVTSGYTNQHPDSLLKLLVDMHVEFSFLLLLILGIISFIIYFKVLNGRILKRKRLSFKAIIEWILLICVLLPLFWIESMMLRPGVIDPGRGFLGEHGVGYPKSYIGERDIDGNPIKLTNGKTVLCSGAAKRCPDGSSVGRVPPNCEFEACPNKIRQSP